jgi:POT family proton-dependent oligopeptide transporter
VARITLWLSPRRGPHIALQLFVGRRMGSSAVHPLDRIEGVRAVLRVLIVFALVTPFWSLFDQKASIWILQADQIVKPARFSSEQMQALNPALVVILIPFNNLVVYPAPP